MSERLGPVGAISRSIGSGLLRRAGRIAARVQERRGLESDLLESDDAYRVVFDAPGATASDVQVRYGEGGVSVRIDRFREFHEGFEMRFPGRGLSLDGRVELPEEAAIDPDAADATLTDHGTLEIELPKTEDAPAHTELDVDESGVELGDVFEAGEDLVDSGSDLIGSGGDLIGGEEEDGTDPDPA